VHSIDVLLVQRWLFETPAFTSGLAIGPVTLQTPHGRVLPPQSVATVASPRSTIFETCARPVQPLSRRAFNGSPTTEIAAGQGLPLGVAVAVGPALPVTVATGVPADVARGVLVRIGVGAPVGPVPPLSLLSPQWAIASAMMA